MDNQIFQGTIRGTRRREYRPYVQDNWKVRIDLTLNLGLAYNITTPAIESHNRQTNFDPLTGNFLIAGVNSGAATGVNTYFGGLEPRIGFAWSPRNDRNWAIRGGYAIFHDSGWDLGAQNLWLNPPFVTAPSFFADNISPSTTFTPEQGFPVGGEPTSPSQFVGESLNLTPFHPHTGTVQQFNLNVQRQLPGEFLVTVGYTHSLSAHLLTSNLNLNTPPPNTTGVLPPFPQYGSINCFCDRGSARYDGLQIKVETKSVRHGLYMLLGYTYSKGFDNGFADFQLTPGGVEYFPLQVPHNSDKGLSQIHLTHNFTGSLIYDLTVGSGRRFGTNFHGAANTVLGNWEFNAIAHLTSGFPLFMTTAVNNSGTSLGGNVPGSNRPERICNGGLSGSQQSVNEWFNTSCFVDPPPGVLGNAARSELFGPNFINFDISLFKTFPLSRIREGTSLQFRSEFFNIFNHPQFFQPGTDEGGADFGHVLATVNNPRLVQFALKLIF